MQDVNIQLTRRRHRSQRLLEMVTQLPAALEHVPATVLPGFGNSSEHVVKGRHVVARLGRKVRAAVEGRAIRCQEDRHRPTARASHGLDRLHVDAVQVRPLFTIDFDVDESRIHELRGARVLERLALHHVAPVAGGVADRQQDRPVLGPCAGQRLFAPRIPVDRIVRVLEQVRARLVRQVIGHS